DGFEVALLDVGADLDVAADADAARDAGILADDRDAGGEVPRLALVRSEVVPVADDHVLADHDVLVEDGAVQAALGANDGVGEDDRVAHDRALPHVDARGEHRAGDGAVDDTAVGDQAAYDAGALGEAR